MDTIEKEITEPFGNDTIEDHLRELGKRHLFFKHELALSTERMKVAIIEAKELGMTHWKIAKLLGVSRPYVVQILRALAIPAPPGEKEQSEDH